MSPLVFRHTTSDFPSPVEIGCGLSCGPAATAGGEPSLGIEVPLMNQMEVAPFGGLH